MITCINAQYHSYTNKHKGPTGAKIGSMHSVSAWKSPPSLTSFFLAKYLASSLVAFILLFICMA
jgi:hypothetical protein